ncbi:MAG: DNA-processing protein DprA [Ruminococcus sp.]|nr:DNA-processing protein DprA [Ruminococcus sp.]MDE7225312.1 DNA-processing protein DprA [Ruminococcus sp.]
MEDKIYWIWLSLVFGVANRRLWQIMNIYESASEAFYAMHSGSTGKLLNRKEQKSVREIPLKNAESIAEECRKRNIGITTYSDIDYPLSLKYISVPPAVLYYKGNINCINGAKTITSVGTRYASEYSIYAASRICSELAEHNIIIVSGFAVGVDIASNLAAVSMNKPTVCVMGCGVDVDYPRDNFQYRDRILESGGLFISEYLPGTPPASANFPKRNRILSALGRATMIFEASSKSGALITAHHAVEQGRDVFVLPPANIFSNAYSGNVELLSDGAIPLMSAEDIIDFFSHGSPVDDIVKEEAFVVLNQYEKSQKSHNSCADRNPDKEEYEEYEIRTDDVSENFSVQNIDSFEGLQRDILLLLAEEKKLHADVICSRLSIDSAVLMAELTELEISGAVSSNAGRIYEIII